LCSSVRTGKLNATLTEFVSWTNRTLANMSDAVARLNKSGTPPANGSTPSFLAPAEMLMNLSNQLTASENRTGMDE
jgi:menaquinone-dependent protoporphyrinogen IX oxidase